MIRLVATDLDGTLLRSDGTVSGRTRATLARVQGAGIVVVVVTARPPHAIRALAADAGIGGLAICGNGSIIYDVANDAVLRTAFLDAEATARIVRAVRDALPGVAFAMHSGLRHGWEPHYVVIHPPLDGNPPECDDALVLCRDGVTKLIVQHPTLPLPDLLHRVREIAGDAAVVTHSGAPFVEVSAAGVTKAWALAALCADLGIAAADVIAFGDMPNDLPMLHWAGTSVAVANAHPELLAIADTVATANDADGVALTLERLLDER